MSDEDQTGLWRLWVSRRWKCRCDERTTITDLTIFSPLSFLVFVLKCPVCSIRNFLTLFLSIEVSKAMREVAEEKLKGDDARASLAEHRVNCFTNQLNDSNPILTEISNAMTDEDNCRSQREAARLAGDVGTYKIWQERLELASRKKQEGNAKLMACSSRYENMMRAIREKAEQTMP